MRLSIEPWKSGIVVPLGALRTARSGGVGEYPDLPVLGGLCESCGLSFIQLLPVNDTGFQSSPYSALSAFALHPLYLRLSDLPEAADFRAETRALAARFEGERRFPYPEILSAKLSLLSRIFAASAPKLREDPALAAWIAANPWVRDYSVFLGLKEENGGKSWKDWPARRDPGAGEVEALWEEPSRRDGRLFHAWVQMRCEEQFLAASRTLADRGVALKGDLPILMNDDSADVWAHRTWFRTDRIAGAPPDMFSELGQNWGFPIYDWEALAREDYAFWTGRLRQAAKFYGAYRIDHVLGFFRIWALSEREESGYLGAFEPGAQVSRAELAGAGFSEDRIRWISEPHIREPALLEAAGRAAAAAGAPEPGVPGNAAASAGAAEGIAARAAGALLDRIGLEPLFLFKRSVRGEKDIRAAGPPDALRDFLQAAWRDRVLIPLGPDSFAFAWRHNDASAWPSLSDAERSALEGLLRAKAAESEKDWEDHGRRLLSVLKGAADMLPCAEDLGAVPSCVPKVLADLEILGLRIPRWTRRWDEPGQPYVEPSDYPRLTVCAPSVHDTSTLRDWWEREAGPGDRRAAYGGDAPEAWSPEVGAEILARFAGGASVLLVVQLQDLLDLSPAYASGDSRSDRINVPGTLADSNWTWRMPVRIEDLAADRDWVGRVSRAVDRTAGRG